MNKQMLALVVVCFTACIKSVDEPILIIDPPVWSYSAVWIETSKGTEDATGFLIENGSELKMWWNQLQHNNTAYIGGTFQYNSRYFHAITDTAGYYSMSDSLLILYKFPDEVSGKQDTTAVLKYFVRGTQLIIKDTTVTPAVEYMYQKKL